jgi:hypothetical protein
VFVFGAINGSGGVSDPEESFDEQSCVASSRMTHGLEACHKIIENYRLMLVESFDETDARDPDEPPPPS